MTLRKIHRLSALLIAAFACIHIANHLVGLSGIEAHIEFMRSARLFYRQPVIEALLLLAIVLQVVTGITLIIERWKQRRGFLSWLQVGSGAYLAFFFLNHVAAVFYGRNTLHVDTNFYYAVAGVHMPVIQFYFVLYYFLAVLALFTHLGCALYWRLQTHSRTARTLAVALPSIVGCVISLLIVLSLAGAFYPVNIPSEYKVIFSARP